MTPCIGYITRIVIALLATGFGLKAQMPFPKYNFRHLNIQNGLSQNVVYHFFAGSAKEEPVMDT